MDGKGNLPRRHSLQNTGAQHLGNLLLIQHSVIAAFVQQFRMKFQHETGVLVVVICIGVACIPRQPTFVGKLIEQCFQFRLSQIVLGDVGDLAVGTAMNELLLQRFFSSAGRYRQKGKNHADDQQLQKKVFIFHGALLLAFLSL